MKFNDVPPLNRALIGIAVIAGTLLLQAANVAGSLNRTMLVAQILGVGAIGFAAVPVLAGGLGGDSWRELSLVRQMVASFVLMVALFGLLVTVTMIKGALP